MLRGFAGVLLSLLIGAGSWFFMDWIESRTLMAQTAQNLERVIEQADANTHAIKDQEEHDHKVDLAIQRLTDMLAVHDEYLHEIREDSKKRRR